MVLSLSPRIKKKRTFEGPWLFVGGGKGWRILVSGGEEGGWRLFLYKEVSFGRVGGFAIKIVVTIPGDCNVAIPVISSARRYSAIWGVKQLSVDDVPTIWLFSS